MLSERDRAVVAEMCRTGMVLEVLKKSFPQFDAEDIEKIYWENHAMDKMEMEEEMKISCNCS